MLKLSMVAFVLSLGTAPALACDDVCKDSEIYSDAEEMCVPKPVQS